MYNLGHSKVNRCFHILNFVLQNFNFNEEWKYKFSNFKTYNCGTSDGILKINN